MRSSGTQVAQQAFAGTRTGPSKNGDFYFFF
uniref:Uncharacterized protein n=1 Tax=Anguilla anguilla TaxID=7936 RepID=A0A0E9QVU2_ANGAN